MPKRFHCIFGHRDSSNRTKFKQGSDSNTIGKIGLRIKSDSRPNVGSEGENSSSLKVYENEYFSIFKIFAKEIAEILLGTTPQSDLLHTSYLQWIATMDFERSSQARSWLFDSSTLLQCREKALTDKPKGSSSLDRVRRFASGFHRRHAGTAENVDPPHTNRQVSSSSALTVEEQEMLVRFHAMQITQLIGPMAMLNGLVRNSAILATAVMLFRRFYMSNSVLDYEPRRIAVAAAYLASKVGEQRVEVSTSW